MKIFEKKICSELGRSLGGALVELVRSSGGAQVELGRSSGGARAELGRSSEGDRAETGRQRLRLRRLYNTCPLVRFQTGAQTNNARKNVRNHPLIAVYITLFAKP